MDADKSIRILRIGHRYVRDYRTLTHLCLVSRALGAEAVYLEEIDDGLLESVREVNEAWGGEFRVLKVPSWRSALSEAKKEGRTVIHLTMYGMPLLEKVGELRKSPKLLIAVGGPKVPAEAYHMADYNISVTSQPHSEIAALAIVLHELQSGEELKKEFGSARMKIIPSERGKQVEKTA
ncbi:MAG TPA: tRNA (cytidine(56)-2'-O)-methyltransferase [Nitrososphaerales archaeon]|nr:tRNA (cytidine(56)-2'-O)-methyltransferase [Nitrososphaerales archaeon]